MALLPSWFIYVIVVNFANFATVNKATEFYLPPKFAQHTIAIVFATITRTKNNTVLNVHRLILAFVVLYDKKETINQLWSAESPSYMMI